MMLALIAFQARPLVDPGLPPKEAALMRSVLAHYPGDPGTAYLFDRDGTVHSNRVGAAARLVRWRPVPGQPGVFTDGEETCAFPHLPPPRFVPKAP